MKTNMDNYEERFVDYMEGQLDAAEMKEVEAFVAQHPELEEDFKLFCASKLKSDETVVFEKKENLMRTTTVIRPLFVRIVAAAACVALLIGVGIRFLKSPQEHVKQPLLSSLTPIKACLIEPRHEEMQLNNSYTKKPRIPQSVPERQELELMASLDVRVPLQMQWDGTIVYDDIQSRMIKELDDRIALMEPFGDLEPLEENTLVERRDKALASLQDHVVDNARQLGRSLYKQTAKSIMTAYYTADGYLDEAKGKLK